MLLGSGARFGSRVHTQQTCGHLPIPPHLRLGFLCRPHGDVRSSSEHSTVAAAHSSWRGETPEQALQRRARESQQVEERVVEISDENQFGRELDNAGSKLVVLEIESDKLCQTGLDEEAELQWKQDQEAALLPCQSIKGTLQRTARDCPDVKFLSLNADTQEGERLCELLGVDVIPTVQFWRNGQKLWEHKGVLQLEQDLGEGVLYFGDRAAGGVQASNFVAELHNERDLDAFVNGQDEKVLTVVDVSLSNANPCIHIYPAVVALARSFKGYAVFGRLQGDESAETQAMLQRYNIVQVPTFLFFKGGKEVMRHVGSSRGDLIGKILEVQGSFGVQPPPPPPRVVQQRSR